MLEVEKPADMKAHVGQQIGTSDWVLVDQAMIDKFAEATGDRQWIHVDVGRAKREMPGGINYGSNKVRFTAPVPAGSRVRLHQTLKNVEDIEGGVRMTFDSQIEVEGSSRPALVAENIGLAFD